MHYAAFKKALAGMRVVEMKCTCACGHAQSKRLHKFVVGDFGEPDLCIKGAFALYYANNGEPACVAGVKMSGRYRRVLTFTVAPDFATKPVLHTKTTKCAHCEKKAKDEPPTPPTPTTKAALMLKAWKAPPKAPPKLPPPLPKEYACKTYMCKYSGNKVKDPIVCKQCAIRLESQRFKEHFEGD